MFVERKKSITVLSEENEMSPKSPTQEKSISVEKTDVDVSSPKVSCLLSYTSSNERSYCVCCQTNEQTLSLCVCV